MYFSSCQCSRGYDNMTTLGHEERPFTVSCLYVHTCTVQTAMIVDISIFRTPSRPGCVKVTGYNLLINILASPACSYEDELHAKHKGTPGIIHQT